jgi:hypothetical protein
MVSIISFTPFPDALALVDLTGIIAAIRLFLVLLELEP